MKNNKGFTIVEIISVIAVISLLMIICVPLIGNTSTNIKKKALHTKIENIEKAAVLYGQDNKENLTKNPAEVSECLNKRCKNGDNTIENCYCYNGTIKVSSLINGKYIESDNESGNITNPLNETKYLNDCEVQIYEKYGKVYAVYLNKTDEDIGSSCWYQE